ncbi:hypothetical protein CATYP_01930 [Corynebacterium atypicum]|uniref:Uncharacterized protein n=1 Tax=Corynebacterium atypicum TaxID=191610 RepID=A0ABM5QLF8_9CORY|nr:hypothetical protein [Corynebacterium atypicum]AIG63640.1 hypothetical protein CATYP_01930 [Corynebacterium atypicum]
MQQVSWGSDELLRCEVGVPLVARDYSWVKIQKARPGEQLTLLPRGGVHRCYSARLRKSFRSSSREG